MKNNENIQMPEINEVEAATANEMKVAENIQEPAKKVEKEKEHRRICLGGLVEQMSMLVMAAGLAVVMLVSLPWVKYTVAGICALAFLVPVAIRAARKRGGINTEKVCCILRKRGFSHVVNGDEIRWTSNGKECILRVRSQCQVEISREYDLPPIPAVIEGNQKAALETMKEVYLAKVTVRDGNGNSRVAFSTESLCVSAKEFSAYLPMCIEILDLAEDRQKEHIMEIRNGKGENIARKIGFLHPDGTIR